MISDLIRIKTEGEGQEEALREAEQVAAWCGLSERDTLHSRLIAEEMMGLIRTVAGAVDAEFHLEAEGKRIDFILTTAILMNQATRDELLSTSTSHKNESAASFLGHLRDFFERAMLSGAGSYVFAENMNEIPVASLPKDYVFDPEWDHYERSILKNLSDYIRIGIRGSRVEMDIFKDFGK